jgi:hypothetical protein
LFQHLELTEKEYFGLVFCEGGGPLPAGPAPDVTRWLDPAKQIRKQMRVKGLTLLTLHFRSVALCFIVLVYLFLRPIFFLVILFIAIAFGLSQNWFK